MSPRIYSCALCGWAILDWTDLASVNPRAPEAWANQFRGVCHSPNTAGASLTGVGLYNDPYSGAFIAPRDSTKHWADRGYTSLLEDQFGVLRQSSVNGRHGFVFHDACWSLLEEAMRPAPVPLQRLLDVCMSLPMPAASDGVSWGHGYGGLVEVDDVHAFPWEDRFRTREFPGGRDEVFGANPYRVTEVDDVLAEEPETPAVFLDVLQRVPTTGEDCFLRLPEELCAEIAMLLPTADVLNARLASKAFWSVYHSQQFWASRFWSSAADRSWPFEVRRHAARPRDWRWLYRRTSDARIGPSLRNRRRIWGLIQGVVDIISLTWNKVPPHLAAPVWSPDDDGGDRFEATGRVWPGARTASGRRWFEFENGCRTFHQQRVTVPANLARLAVSTVALGDGEYIAGLSLITDDGNIIRLGYSSSSPEKSIEVSEIWGFHLAIGARGIQAFQCLTGPGGQESRWLGSPENVPRTDRLAVAARVSGLEAAFDGCKMVGFAIHTSSPFYTNDLSQSDPYSFRNAAVWYPTIPPPTLQLNDESFAPRKPFMEMYMPLFWCHFGGPGGKYLPHLTQISSCHSDVRRIHFSFGVEVPVEHQTFGRLANKDKQPDTVFPIDGPGGERITSIEIGHRYPKGRMHPWMKSEGVLFFTDRGRSFLISDNPLKVLGVNICKRITPAPGEAITGLYAAQRPEEEYGITALGVITEKIGNVGS